MAAKKEIKINVERDEAEDQDTARIEPRTDESDSAEDIQDVGDGTKADGLEKSNDNVEGRPVSSDPDERIAELEDRLLRAHAEFENYKKRTARQYEDMVRAAGSRLLMELLEIVDSFERAFEHIGNEASTESLLAGMELIHGQLKGLLDKNQVTAIEAVGQPFDPGLHEAIMQIDSEDHAEGIVALEMTKGYRLGDKVLRFAQVAVSKGAARPEDNGPESEDQVD
ncbi:MAG: nucleotide exchange factor GrpE [bacterium]